jgi:hypothetical protein
VRNIQKVNRCLEVTHTVETLQSKGCDLASIFDKDDFGRAMADIGRYFPVLYFAHNSASAAQAGRARTIAHQRYVGRVNRTMTHDLPDAMDAAERAGKQFLSKNVPEPPSRKRRKRKNRLRQRREAREYQEERSRQQSKQDKARRRKVYVAIDLCPGKGQRTSGCYPYRRLMNGVRKLAASQQAQRDLIEYRVMDGRFTSKQASAFQCVVDGTYADMQDITEEQLTMLVNGSRWSGPRPDPFKYKLDPVSGRIRQRDTPPPEALIAAHVADRMEQPRPLLLTHQRRQLPLSKSASTEREGGPVLAKE